MMRSQKQHEPKGKSGRPSNIKKHLKKQKTPHMTPKRMRTEPELIGEKQQDNI